MTKICTKCCVEKTLTEFYPDKRHPSGCKTICKNCWKGYTKDRRKKANLLAQTTQLATSVMHKTGAKFCHKCCCSKAVSEFYVDKYRPGGLFSECKSCWNREGSLKQLKKALLRPPKPSEPAKTSKPCSKCGIEKPLAEFFKDSRDATGRTSACNLCEAERKKTAYESDPAVFSERKKSYRARNLEKVREGHRKYKKENPERGCAQTTARNARKRNAIPPWETNVIAAETQWRKDYPGMTLDHIVPITPPVSASLGGRPIHRSNRTFVGPLIPIVYGLHTRANWQPLENLENARKNNRDWPDAPWSDNV